MTGVTVNGLDIQAYTAARVEDFEKQNESAGKTLQDTAKWIISGIAVAAAGVIAGASLSSLAALAFAPRFYVAVGTAALGYLGLGFIFRAALEVIAPRDHSLQDIADGKGISGNWQSEIEEKVQPLLFPARIKTLKEFCDYAAAPTDEGGNALAGSDLVTFNLARRLVEAKAKAAERELKFRRLTQRAFVVTPLVAIVFIAFGVAAFPTKEELHAVPAMQKSVEVAQSDVPVLRAAFANPACVSKTLQVIVLGEWPSGVQDVVTVPSPSCPPVRLRLDHSRFSAEN
jgi:ABC-type xylose transport system permease subunit